MATLQIVYKKEKSHFLIYLDKEINLHLIKTSKEERRSEWILRNINHLIYRVGFNFVYHSVTTLFFKDTGYMQKKKLFDIE